MFFHRLHSTTVQIATVFVTRGSFWKMTPPTPPRSADCFETAGARRVHPRLLNGQMLAPSPACLRRYTSPLALVCRSFHRKQSQRSFRYFCVLVSIARQSIAREVLCTLIASVDKE